MAERNAKLLEVGFGQIRKDFEIDSVVATVRLVLAQSQFVKPGPDVHGAPRNRPSTSPIHAKGSSGKGGVARARNDANVLRAGWSCQAAGNRLLSATSPEIQAGVIPVHATRSIVAGRVG